MRLFLAEHNSRLEKIMIYVFLAQGFEEVEALAPIDLLRRCGKEVITVGVNDNIIVGSHNIPIVTDTITQEIKLDDTLEMIILPGGMPGTINLENDPAVQEAIDFCVKNDKFIGAICAAPSILGHKGILKNKKAVCFEGFENQLEGADISKDSVMADGNIITARGAGVAIQFGLKLVEVLISKERSDTLKAAILCK